MTLFLHAYERIIYSNRAIQNIVSESANISISILMMYVIKSCLQVQYLRFYLYIYLIFACHSIWRINYSKLILKQH